MSRISSPYRFVPLSPLVMLPDWSEQVSHDHPFKDGVCGKLTLELTAHTPLCVGGKQDKSSETRPGNVHFFRTPDGQLAIPGSSLKGMLRNVLEIASFSRFKQVEDQRLGVRDISKSKNFYTKAITQKPAHAGWLRFVKGQWEIIPCNYSRLHQQDLIDWSGVVTSAWCNANTAQARYRLIGLLPELRFDTEQHETKGRIAKPAKDGTLQGQIIVTGQPGNPFNQGKSSKKYEFVFHALEEGGGHTTKVVEDTVMRGFQFIYGENDDWRFWRQELASGKLELGIPVFFHASVKGEVTSLGLSLMYKLPYKHSLHQAIGHTHPIHLGGEAPDLADLIFGCIDDAKGSDGSHSLRGRVAFGLGQLQGSANTTTFGPTVLSSPKPTYYPAYIRQDKPTEFCQLMQDDSKLAGWKRYPAKPLNVLRAPDKSGPKSQITLEAVPVGTRFHFTLHVHNLRQVELGALLWALDFGGRSELRHGLGLGKPYGLGQVALKLNGWNLRPNDPSEAEQRESDSDHESSWLRACRQEFTRLMDECFTRAGIEGRWSSSGPIKALCEHATPANNHSAGELEYLRTPKNYQDLKDPALLEDWKSIFHMNDVVEPPKGFDTSSHQPFKPDFDASLQAITQAEAVALEKATQAAVRENASCEERLLMDLGTSLQRFETAGSGKPALEHLNKCLRAAIDAREHFSPDELSQLEVFIERCSQIDDKKIGKACRKYRRGPDGDD